VVGNTVNCFQLALRGMGFSKMDIRFCGCKLAEKIGLDKSRKTVIVLYCYSTCYNLYGLALIKYFILLPDIFSSLCLLKEKTHNEILIVRTASVTSYEGEAD
jgi:hypothetical protein